MESRAHGRTHHPPPRHNGVPCQAINIIMLSSAAVSKGCACPFWLTFRQVQELGRYVRKRETGELVVYAGHITRTTTDDKGEQIERKIAFLKGYTVLAADGIRRSSL